MMASLRPNSWLAANYRLIMVAVLLIAALLRLYGINNQSPPGLEHDEVAHWLINQDILNGNQGLYFAGAYGHEAGYHYLQSGFMVLLGDNVMALRLPSAYLGLLVVAVAFALARRLFDLKTAVLSAALLAALFWPVFYSRLGLRAISLPLLSGLSAYFWWQGWLKWGNGEDKTDVRGGAKNAVTGTQPNSRNRALKYFLIAGLLASLSFYTYMASRVVPIFYGLYVIYLVLFHRPALRERWRAVALFFLTYAIVTAPLALYLLGNPGVEYRLAEINQPLTSLLDGNLRPALENSLKILSMFGLRGDPLWRQNVAHLPVFEPLVAIFFYIGLVISLLRWREQRYTFLLLWLLTSSIPSIVSIDAPSSIRIINILPVLTLFPVIGLKVIHFLRPFSTVFAKLSPKNARIVVFITLVMVLSLYIARTSSAVFREWPAASEVKFVWQEALTEVAAYLDDSTSTEPIAVGGWTPASMDPPTMELTLVRQDLSIRHFDPTQGLIIPSGGQPGGDVRIARPSGLPLDPFLEERLISWGAFPQTIGSFTLYEVPFAAFDLPETTANVVFGGEITFLGFDPLSFCSGLGPENASGSPTCEAVSYWRVEKPVAEPRRIFLHAVDEQGTILDQDDGLGAPAEHWEPGDLILQRHTLNLSPREDIPTLRLGVYNPETGLRLLTSNGQEFIEDAPFE
ncbi:MAG: glycosyltransferase family 39 protein [Candidatus Promineifilaceae bacterium]